MTTPGRFRILLLAREFPNPAKPRSGLWALGGARALQEHADLRVVAPVPRVPPVPVWGLWKALRAVPRERSEGGLLIYHPRQFVGLGQSLYEFEGETYLRTVRNLLRRLRADWVPDALHAHFVYPDGYAAARLSEELGIPFFITEHAFWSPGMDAHPRIRDEAVSCARRAARVVAVSEALRRSIVDCAGNPGNVVVIPNGVDVSVFSRDGAPETRDSLSLLYVGWLTYHKGLDLLVRAMPSILRERPDAQLTVVGESLFRTQRRQEREIRALAERLGAAPRIRFAGGKSPAEVARAMNAAAVVVVPSRRESFGTVIVEAMACGRPVVATESGGPKDLITPEAGLLVPPEDPEALASAVVDVARNLDRYDPERIRARAVECYSWPVVAEKIASLYAEALG
ncbi:MAG TPA: glycosyltransferase [Thermoanaerobaculia bacterium]|jgi:glycosyltransferase involved in cell wall biosynthesis